MKVCSIQRVLDIHDSTHEDMPKSIHRIETDELLEGVSELEKAPGGRGGEVATPQLEHAQARKGQE
jgi:hypothetical protein